MAGSPHPLSVPDVESRLRARFGEDILEVAEQHGHAVASVASPSYHDLCRFLRDDPGFACNYCDFTSGVDCIVRPSKITALGWPFLSASRRSKTRKSWAIASKQPALIQRCACW